MVSSVNKQQNAGSCYNQQQQQLTQYPGPLKQEWLVTILERIFRNELETCNAAPIGEGTGFLSFVYKISVSWKNEAEHQVPTSLILKLPTSEKVKLDGNEDMPGPTLDQLIQDGHNTECALYEEVFNKNQKNLFDDFLPLVFGCERFGLNIPFILFSDLSSHGKTPDLFRGLSLAQAKAALKQLANIQAFSLLKTSWTTLPELVKNDIFYSAGGLKGWQYDARLCAESVRKAQPDLMSKLSDEKLEKLANVKAYAKYCLGDEGRRVLVHGDLWMNNLMYGIHPKEPSTTTEELVAFLDWQLSFEGCWSKDLCFLLISSLPYRLRQQHEMELVQEYFECFTQGISAVEENLRAPFTLKALLESYRKGLVFNAIQFLSQVSYILANPELLKKRSSKEIEELSMRFRSILDESE